MIVPHPRYTLVLLTLVCPTVWAADSDDQTPDGSCQWCPDVTGWSGWVEGGLGHVSDDNDWFGRYTGETGAGVYADASGDLVWRDAEGQEFSARASHLGLDARSVELSGGVQGQYQLELDYQRIPNLRERDAWTIFRPQPYGIALPLDWTPGDSTQRMPDLGEALTRVPLSTERDRTSARVTLYPVRDWQVSAYARVDRKQGVRDWGATFGFYQTVILPIPFDYETDEFGLSLGYTGERLQARIDYLGSLFKSERNYIRWQNPYEDTASNTAWGQMAEAPDNQFHQISARLGYQPRDDLRFTARLARGRMTQDEALLPYTINPAIVTAPLPAASADARLDTTLAVFEINARPSQPLRLDASYSYSDRDNNTPIRVWDYVTTDLGPGGKRINRPYSFRQELLRLKGAYRFSRALTLSAGYEDDSRRRDYTEVEENQEKTLWLELASHPLTDLEARFKYAHSDRDASPYVALSDLDPLLDNPSENFFNNPAMRVLHYADRKRDKPTVALSWTPRPRLTLGLDLAYLKDRYDGDHLGMQQARGGDYTLSASWALTDDLSLSSWFSRNWLASEQRGEERMFADRPGSPWLLTDSFDTRTLGVGVQWSLLEGRLDLGADLTFSDYTGSMEFASGAALPELGARMSALDLSGVWRYTDNLSLRLRLRHERYDEQDWTRDGFVNSDPALLSLGSAPRDDAYSAVLLTLRYEFPVE